MGFHEKRSEFVNRRKSGCKQGVERTGATKKSTVSRKRSLHNDLLPPADDFLPYQDYLEIHGDPRTPENKRRGHRLTKHPSGVKGVVMPAAKGMPWKYQRRYGDEVANTDILDEDDQEDLVAEDQTDMKFESIVKEQEDAYAKAAVGISLAELLNKVASGYPESDVSESEGAPRRRGRRSPVGRAKQRSSKRMTVCSDSSDEPRSGKKARGKPTAAGSLGGKRGFAGSRSKGSGNGGGASSAANSKWGPGGEPKEVSEQQDKPKPVGQRGRKPKPVNEIVSEQVAMFETANEDSIYFGDKMQVQLKCIRRYIAAASQKVASTKKDELDHAEMMKKQLQMIETCMKSWSTWTARACSEKGLQEFDNAWSALQVFLDSSPKLELRSEFMWHLFLQTKCMRVKSAALTDELAPSKLSVRFPSVSARGEVGTIQRKCVCELLTTILQSHSSALSEIENNLQNNLASLLDKSCGLEEDLLEELRCLQALVNPRLQASVDEHKFLKESIAKIDVEEAVWWGGRGAEGTIEGTVILKPLSAWSGLGGHVLDFALLIPPCQA